MTIEKQLRSIVNILRLAVLLFATAEVVTEFFEHPAPLILGLDLAPWIAGGLVSIACLRFKRFVVGWALVYVLLVRLSVVAFHLMRIADAGYSIAAFGSICLVLWAVSLLVLIENSKVHFSWQPAPEPEGSQTFANE